MALKCSKEFAATWKIPTTLSEKGSPQKFCIEDD